MQWDKKNQEDLGLFQDHKYKKIISYFTCVINVRFPQKNRNCVLLGVYLTICFYFLEIVNFYVCKNNNQYSSAGAACFTAKALPRKPERAPRR